MVDIGFNRTAVESQNNEILTAVHIRFFLCSEVSDSRLVHRRGYQLTWITATKFWYIYKSQNENLKILVFEFRVMWMAGTELYSVIVQTSDFLIKATSDELLKIRSAFLENSLQHKRFSM